MRKQIFILLPIWFVLTVFSTGFAEAQNPNAVLGVWLTTLGKAHVEIIRDAHSGLYSGKIIWLKEPNDKDGKPAIDKNGNAAMNLVILKNMKFDGKDWINGTIYDPETTKTYYCTIHLKNNTMLEVRGSLDSMGWIGQTEEWVKVTK